MPRIAVIAGEPSGDQLGAGLIEALRARRPDLRVEGIAGPRMQAAGCIAWREADELAVMGLAEVIRHLPRLRRIIRDTRQRLLADPPDVLVGIDAPDFNLRVEPAARRAGIPTVHYVSPSVWAWRQGRVRVLRRACDRVLCLLPFEPDFLEEHGVAATFVGHPLADEIPAGMDPSESRQRLGLTAGTVVGLLPGSRHGELARMGPVFAATAARLANQIDGIEFAAPMATPVLREQFQRTISEHASGALIRLFDGQVREVLAASDAVLVTSGTATLETMLVNRPMVVAYRLAPLTWHLLRWSGLIRVPHIALPNLLAGHRVVPELIQHEASPQRLGDELLALLDDGDRRAGITAEFELLRGVLRRSASERAADAVLQEAGLG